MDCNLNSLAFLLREGGSSIGSLPGSANGNRIKVSIQLNQGTLDSLDGADSNRQTAFFERVYPTSQV
jgi:hypothetical protein